MKSTALIFFSVMILISCNSGTAGKKEENVKTDSLTQTVGDVKAVVDPAINNAPTPGPKCFQNEGLKYRITINLVYFTANDLSGNIAVEEGKKLIDKQRFLGTVNGNEITVKFMTQQPPKLGDASEWVNKPWTINSTLGTETLSMIVNARNYETNQWGETTYEFKACTPTGAK